MTTGARDTGKLLEATRGDAKHPKRIAGAGPPHLLRHAYAIALIQSGENAKAVHTLMGHHSVAFTMDHYADAWSLQRGRESCRAAVRRKW